MPERDTQLADIAAAAKRGALQRSDLDSFLTQTDSEPSVWRRASLLRFAIRMCRHSGFSDAPVRSRLRMLYTAMAQVEAPCTDRLRYWLWAKPPATETTVQEIEHLVLRELEFSCSPAERLRTVARSGLPFRIHASDGAVAVRTSFGWRIIEVGDAMNDAHVAVLAGNIEGDVCRKIGDWSIAGRTRLGKPLTCTNDDGLLVLHRGREVLLAVADGTGDSQFGHRASSVALSSLAEAYLVGAPIELATECAAASVLADNLVWGLDGVTTLAVCAIDDSHRASIAAFGDPVVAVYGQGGLVYESPSSFDVRVALGGEPLGDTITSSGRTVGRLDCVELGSFAGWPDANGVALGTDGLILGHPDWRALEPEMDGTFDSAQRIVVNLISGAEKAIANGRKADNLTALVALRGRSG